jgi:glycosyltransferase involved in cell wall biosynthesis
MGIHLNSDSGISEKKPNISIVTWPIHKSGITPLQNLVNIIGPLSNEIIIITGAAGADIVVQPGIKTSFRRIKYYSSTNKISKIINNAFMQVKISWQMLFTCRRADLYIFYVGASLLLLPMLAAKICRKKVILSLLGSAEEDVLAQFDGSIAQFAQLMIKTNYLLSDKIVVYSENLIRELKLSKFKDKILVGHEHVLDFGKFKVVKPLRCRKNMVGYFGRLSQEKGIMVYVEAISSILKEKKEIRFCIGGDGPLVNEIKHFLDGNGLSSRVELLGWISHDELPGYLNELRLLVLPSYSEGLPNIMLEAMACGTPVLSTPVGAIPDIVKDGETGFIMENNSVECIRVNLLRALEHPGINQIANNARKMVEIDFSLKKAEETYHKIIYSLS